MKKLFLILALLSTTAAFASSNVIKDIDQINATGGAALSVPSVGSTFDTDSNTVTLSNKSLSGSSNTFTNIPVSAIATGTALGVSAGGTGDTSLTINGIVYGNGTSALGVTSAGSQYNVCVAGSGGVPTMGTVNLASSAAVGTSILGVVDGGTGLATLTSGAVVIGAGTSTPTFVAPGTNGNVLTNVSGVWTSQAPSASGGAPNISGTYASPTAVTAGGGVTVAGLISNGPNYAFVSGSGGAVTVTATPSVAGCSSAATPGTTVTIVGGTNAVTLQDSTSLASSGLSLNGNWTSASGRVLTLFCASATGPWIELSRSN